MSVLRAAIGTLAIVGLTGCVAMPEHEFAAPATDWQTRSGQLLYRSAQTTLIGDVLVRFSKTGDFELTFSKGPGVTLLTIRQDTSFAEVKGAIAGRGWAGPYDQAPRQLRGWLALRDRVIHAPTRQSIRYASGTESFVLRL